MPPNCGCKKKSKRRRKSRCKSPKQGIKKTCSPGKVTRNAFFNFLRCYRSMNCGKSVIEVAVEGAKIWNKMSPDKKCKYIQQAFKAPRMRRKRKKAKRGKSKRRSVC